MKNDNKNAGADALASQDLLALRICHIEFSLEGNPTNPQFRYEPQLNTIKDHGKEAHTLPEITAMLDAGRLMRDLIQEAEKKFGERHEGNASKEC